MGRGSTQQYDTPQSIKMGYQRQAIVYNHPERIQYTVFSTLMVIGNCLIEC